MQNFNPSPSGSEGTSGHTPALGQGARAVLFDAYGTLFDVYSVAELAEELFPGQGGALAAVWRDKQIDYSRLVTLCNHGAHYRPFLDITRLALRYAIQKIVGYADYKGDEADFDLEFEPQMALLMAQYEQLDPFPENLDVLRELNARGLRCGILSNGDPAMLAAAVHSAGMDALIDPVISVDAVRKFKTHPDAYALGEQHTGLAARDIVFVSSNGWDALGATWYGYQTLWVNRYQLPPETLGPRPHRCGRDLRAVLDFFI